MNATAGTEVSTDVTALPCGVLHLHGAERSFYGSMGTDPVVEWQPVDVYVSAGSIWFEKDPDSDGVLIVTYSQYGNLRLPNTSIEQMLWAMAWANRGSADHE